MAAVYNRDKDALEDLLIHALQGWLEGQRLADDNDRDDATTLPLVQALQRVVTDRSLVAGLGHDGNDDKTTRVQKIRLLLMDVLESYAKEEGQDQIPANYSRRRRVHHHPHEQKDDDKEATGGLLVPLVLRVLHATATADCQPFPHKNNDYDDVDDDHGKKVAWIRRAVPLVAPWTLQEGDSPEASPRAWRFLERVALTETGARAILALPTLRNAFLDHQDNPSPAVNAASVLVNVTGHVACHAACVPLLAPLCQAMRLNHPQEQRDALLAQAACQVWWNLLAPLPSSPPSTRNRRHATASVAVSPVWHAWQDGHQGLDCVVDHALRAHPTHAGVQTAASGALSAVVVPQSFASDNHHRDGDNHRHYERMAILADLCQTLRYFAIHRRHSAINDEQQQQGNSNNDDNDFDEVVMRALRAVANLTRDCRPAQIWVRHEFWPNDPLDPNNATTSSRTRTRPACMSSALIRSLGDASPQGALALLDLWASLLVGCSLADCTAILGDLDDNDHVSNNHDHETIVTHTVRWMRTTHATQPTVLDAAALVLWAIAQHYGKYVHAQAADAVAQAIDTYGADRIRYGRPLQKRLQWKQRWGRR